MGHLIWTGFGAVLALLAIYSVITANKYKKEK